MDAKRTSSHFTADRISNLPCNVMDNIFKYLPLRDTVRTSILSKGWQYKYLSSPYLVFDRSFEEELPVNYNIESIIYKILLLHKKHIVKFTYEEGVSIRHPIVNHWLHFLSNHRIEELTLRFPYSLPTMPNHLYTFDQLQHLHLCKFKLSPPSTFKGFGRLVTLVLNDVHMSTGEFNRLISKCPMLEHLTLDYRYCNSPFAELELDAPNLKIFYLYFRGKFTSISLKNPVLLKDLRIICYEPKPESFKGSQFNLMKFFGELSSVKKLKLDSSFLLLLARGGLPQKLSNNLSPLIDLVLGINFDFVVQVSCALCLIRSSPNLQSLEVMSRTTLDGGVKAVVGFLKAQQEVNLLSVT